MRPQAGHTGGGNHNMVEEKKYKGKSSPKNKVYNKQTKYARKLSKAGQSKANRMGKKK